MIKIKSIRAGYFNNEILHGTKFDISKGEFTGIIGRNGAGKSTLLKVICGILKPFAGTVEVKEKNIDAYSKKDFAQTVAFMPQNVDTSFPFSVRDFVLLGRYPYMNTFKIPSKTDYESVEKVLEFAGIKDFGGRYINELSGGEKQRVLIAQTLAQETEIIIFDEPTSHLDIGSQTDILELLRRLNEEYGKTIITTLHDLNAAGEFCSRLVLLDNGNICNTGTPEQVLNYQDIEKVYKTTVVVKTNPISGKPYIIPVSKREIGK